VGPELLRQTLHRETLAEEAHVEFFGFGGEEPFSRQRLDLKNKPSIPCACDGFHFTLNKGVGGINPKP